MKKLLLSSMILPVLLFSACGAVEVIETETQKDSSSSINNNEKNMQTDNGNGAKVSFEVGASKDEMKLIPEQGDTIATIKTNMGDIKVLLYTKEAPITTQNFIELAKQGKYKNVPFHRIIKDFMIQGGDFQNKNGMGGYSFQGEGTKIPDEFGKGLKHIKGALSMANSGPNSGGSQFFIVQKEDGTDWLNGKHAIFGFVYEGLDIVDKMASVEVGAQDKPLSEVLMLDVEISTK